jgi:drug/metabolite transporter (DMT)-like permease
MPTGGRRRILTTAEGTRSGSFGVVEWGLFIFCGLVWGGSFLLIAISADHFASAVVAFIRVALGALIVAVAPGAWAKVDSRDMPRIILVAAIWMSLPFVLFPWAERSVASSVAGMINAGLPVFTATIAALLLRRAPRRIQVAGLIIGFIGVALIAIPSLSHSRSSALGVLALVIAVLCYAIGVNLTIPLQQRYGTLPPLARIELFASVILLPFALFGLRTSTFAWSALIANVLLGVLATGAAFLAMFTLMGRVGATRSSAVTYLFPVVALTLGVVFRDEPLHAIAVLGAGLVLVGAWLVSRTEHDSVSAPID